MASAEVECGSSATALQKGAQSPTAGSGALEHYWRNKLDALEIIIRDKSQNLRRLEAQRAALNAKGSCQTAAIFCLSCSKLTEFASEPTLETQFATSEKSWSCYKSLAATSVRWSR